MEAVRKGEQFEDETEIALKQLSLRYEKQKVLRGLARRWVVDFFLPDHKTVIECKSVRTQNVGTYIDALLFKVVDMRGKLGDDIGFIIVLKEMNSKMRAIFRCANKYKVKIIIGTKALPHAIHAKVIDVNEKFCPKDTKERVWELLEKNDGLNAYQIAKKLDMPIFAARLALNTLTKEKKLLVLGKRGLIEHGSKRYYRRSCQLI